MSSQAKQFPDLRRHDRHSYMRKTGKRISRGAWERLNRAYAVFLSKKKTIKTKDGVKIIASFTHVLMPDTTKANRKLSMSDRYSPKSKRERFKGEPVGYTR